MGVVRKDEGLTLVLGLRKTDRGRALFPFATLFEQFDAFKALKDGAFAADGGV